MQLHNGVAPHGNVIKRGIIKHKWSKPGSHFKSYSLLHHNSLSTKDSILKQIYRPVFRNYPFTTIGSISKGCGKAKLRVRHSLAVSDSVHDCPQGSNISRPWAGATRCDEENRYFGYVLRIYLTCGAISVRLYWKLPPPKNLFIYLFIHTVKSGNSVTLFLTKYFFSQKFMKVPYFFWQ